MVLTIDLAPTLMELAGLPPLPAMQGRSLAPIFSGTAGAWRESFPQRRRAGRKAIRPE
jgi:arylsulfatase A-like enzyme